MSKIPALTAIRLIPRDSDFLDRKFGSKGEVFFDQTTNSLRIYTGQSQGGISLAKSDLSNISNSAFLAKATAAGVSGGSGSSEFSIAADDSTIRTLTSGNVLKFVGGSGISTALTPDDELIITNSLNTFSSIVVAGQSTVVADALSDTLTLVAGSNITITTDAGSDSITISASTSGGGEASNSFSTIAVATQSNVVADSSADTLTLVAGEGISITTNAATDTVTITNTITSLRFDQLTDISTASLDVDQIYLPAITMLTVSNSGASSYRFDQYGSADNPIIYAINGTTIAFKLTASGHPFLIQNSAGVNYNTGLVHVATNGTVSTGVSAQGKDSGTLYWKIPTDISGSYRYQCSLHAPMVGNITIKAFSTL
jgi:hypothetical protein